MNELINSDNEDIFSAVNDIENVYIKLGRELAIKELEDKLIDSNAYSTGVNYGNNLGEEFSIGKKLKSRFNNFSIMPL